MSKKSETFIAYAKRTPIGNFGGSLANIRVDDLLTHLLIDFKKYSIIPLEEIDDIIIGCANQAGEDNRNFARMSSLMADYPESVPAVTVNRLCGSSLDAIYTGLAKIRSGFGNAYLIGGAENMSRGPYVLSKASKAFARNQEIFDTSLGWRFPNPEFSKRYPLLSMGETAEEVASKYQISREDQDKWAYRSHQLAIKAIKNNEFKDEILPIKIKEKKDEFLFEQDEGPRENASLEKLSKLRPCFKEGGSVTAGNSSSLNDGASLVFICSENFLKKHSLTPLAIISHASVVGLNPNIMGMGPARATQKLLEQEKIKIDNFDHIEMNEAFAVQTLASLKELDADSTRVNPLGGAIALGHPLGCSGTRLITTLAYQMKKNKNIKNALATMCIGVGQGISVSMKSI